MDKVKYKKRLYAKNNEKSNFFRIPKDQENLNYLLPIEEIEYKSVVFLKDNDLINFTQKEKNIDEQEEKRNKTEKFEVTPVPDEGQEIFFLDEDNNFIGEKFDGNGNLITFKKSLIK